MDAKRTIKRKDLFKMLGTFESVRNCPSRNGENQAPNQFEIFYENGRAFQSYSTLIAVRMSGQWYFTDSHDYSVTTSGHCKRFCGYTTQERRKGLKDGTFILITD